MVRIHSASDTHLWKKLLNILGNTIICFLTNGEMRRSVHILYSAMRHEHTGPNVWGDSDEFGNKSVWCVLRCWKLLEPHKPCLVRLNLQSLRVLVVWGLDAIGYSDWLCASESARCVGGRSDSGLHSVPSFPVLDYWHDTNAIRCQGDTSHLHAAV